MELEIRAGKVLRKADRGILICDDCGEVYGPKSMTEIGYTAGHQHPSCSYEIKEWTEWSIVSCAKCDGDATHLEETGMGMGDTADVPYCDDCGYFKR